jgi:hypothetical protein
MQPKSIVNTNKPIPIYNQYEWAVLEQAGGQARYNATDINKTRLKDSDVSWQ